MEDIYQKPMLKKEVLSQHFYFSFKMSIKPIFLLIKKICDLQCNHYRLDEETPISSLKLLDYIVWMRYFCLDIMDWVIQDISIVLILLKKYSKNSSRSNKLPMREYNTVFALWYYLLYGLPTDAIQFLILKCLIYLNTKIK